MILNIINYIFWWGKNGIELYHHKFNELFKHYIITGDMLETVIQYISTNDFAKVISTNQNKLIDLQGDFGRVIDD